MHSTGQVLLMLAHQPCLKILQHKAYALFLIFAIAELAECISQQNNSIHSSILPDPSLRTMLAASGLPDQK